MIETATATLELRDPVEVRSFLLQGLLMQRALPPNEQNIQHALQWSHELAWRGNPLPPTGFVADIGHVAFGLDDPASLSQSGDQQASLLGIHPGVQRTYEDYVLGKLYADLNFDRASAALSRYKDHDRVLGLVYLIERFQQRAGFGGVLLNPAIIQTLQQQPADQTLAEAREDLVQNGLMPLLYHPYVRDESPVGGDFEPESLYERIIQAVRNTGEVLSDEDVEELEQGTALTQYGQRVAQRQVSQSARLLEQHLPRQRVRRSPKQHEVPTHIRDEDTYPIGGYNSISTRGSIESLLHSQLAYMEDTSNREPDLFDIKFLRDELFYYSRDENQFFRRRQTFLFALFPELAETRVKGPELPYQRLILLLGLLKTTVHKLMEWLSEDALKFEFLIVRRPKSRNSKPSEDQLADEYELLKMMFWKEIANGTVQVNWINSEDLSQRCGHRARSAMVHVLSLSPRGEAIECDVAHVTRLKLDSPVPQLAWPYEEFVTAEGDNPLEIWGQTLEDLLDRWA